MAKMAMPLQTEPVAEIAVQGKSDCIQFLGLGNYEDIRRFRSQVVFEAQNLMPDPSQRKDDFIGEGMVCEESQPH
jgi:hypothetical protein